MPSIINWNETSQTLNDLCVDFLLLELLLLVLVMQTVLVTLRHRLLLVL